MGQIEKEIGFTPFFDHRGVATIGKPKYNEQTFKQLQPNKLRKGMATMLKLNGLKKAIETKAIETKAIEMPKLKLGKGINADAIELNARKFDRTEKMEAMLADMAKRIDGIHSVLGRLSSVIDAYNTDIMPGIFSGIKTLNDLQIELNIQFQTVLKNASNNNQNEVKTKLYKSNEMPKTETLTESHKDAAETPSNDLETLAKLWRKHWAGNFCGSQEIDMEAFQVFVSRLDEADLAESFNRASGQAIGEAKYPVSRPGKAKAFEGFKRAYAELTGNASQASQVETGNASQASQASPVIDSKHWVKTLGIGLDAIQEIKNAWLEDADTQENRQAIKDYIKELNSDLNFKEWAKLFNWLNAFRG